MRTNILATLVLLVPARALAQEGGAPAGPPPSYVCCQTWMPSGIDAQCVTSATPNCGPADPIAIPLTYAPAALEEGQCSDGFYDCQITTDARCCYEDCSVDTSVCAEYAPQPRPSCCAGLCLGSPDPQPLNGSCDAMPGKLWACCSPGEILRGPTIMGESSEWAVTFGYEVGAPAADAGDEAGTDDHAHHGGCSVSSPPTSRAFAALLGALLTGVGLRRRTVRRRP